MIFKKPKLFFLIFLATTFHTIFALPAVSSSKKTIIVSFNPETSTIHQSLQQSTFPSRSLRLQATVTALKNHALNSQNEVQKFLQSILPASEITTIWPTNQMIVRGADAVLMETLLTTFPEVSKISEDIQVSVAETFELKLFKKEDILMNVNADEDAQWGIAEIEAPAVWRAGNTGQNITICNLGTGVRGTHEALRKNFRGDYGWFDMIKKTLVPEDGHGLGTHSMGVAVGDLRNIGVAPGSNWAACRACDDFGMCMSSDLLQCGMWVMCPKLADGNMEDCTKAPWIVNNNWGGSRGQDFFEGMLRAWKTAGIIATFPIGGGGPSCMTAASPGDSDLAIGVGATTRDNQVYAASSVGPTQSIRFKPDIAAPGAQIFSAYHLSDTIYATMSGTGTASPHVGGLVAMLLRDSPNLTFEEVLELLAGGAENTVPTGGNCGGISEEQLPNYHVGHGRINAAKSVDIPLH